MYIYALHADCWHSFTLLLLLHSQRKSRIYYLSEAFRNINLATTKLFFFSKCSRDFKLDIRLFYFDARYAELLFLNIYFCILLVNRFKIFHLWKWKWKMIKTAHRVQHCFSPSHKIRWSGKVVDTWQIGQRQSKQPPILYHIVLLLASLRGICVVNLIYFYISNSSYVYKFIYE